MMIEDNLQKIREQTDSVRGKETPFRCVFKTRHGWSYTYHETYEDALKHEHSSCGYSPFGSAWVQRAKKTRIEKEGPRGGWKKYTGETK